MQSWQPEAFTVTALRTADYITAVPLSQVAFFISRPFFQGTLLGRMDEQYYKKLLEDKSHFSSAGDLRFLEIWKLEVVG